MSVILVDLDGVVVDWSAQFSHDLEFYYPDLEFEEMREFVTPTHLPQAHQDAINTVKNRSGFYAEMEPIPYAIDALDDMAEEHTVFLCSAPEIFNATCESDKKTWVRDWLGVEWAKRLILTKDKTMVRGDILIDDRPDVTGVMEPLWRHVIFSAPYNDDVFDKPRLDSWDDWRDVLGKVLV
jgi:Uncharacterized protein conserved in bacteria